MRIIIYVFTALLDPEPAREFLEGVLFRRKGSWLSSNLASLSKLTSASALVIALTAGSSLISLAFLRAMSYVSAEA